MSVLDERPLPLAGLGIVVTRAAHEADDLARRLAAGGATPLVCPVIEIATPPDPDALDAALRRAATFDWIVFTSANGVRAAFERVHALGLGAESWSAPRVAAIGPATADALRAGGVEPRFVPGVFVAEALGDALPDVDGRAVLLLRAEDGRAVLRERLEARGGLVEDIAAYATRPARVSEAILATLLDGADAVTFTAASTVRHFLALPGDTARALLGSAAVATIGPVTTAAARALGVRVDVEAATATMDGLVAGLVRHFAPRYA